MVESSETRRVKAKQNIAKLKAEFLIVNFISDVGVQCIGGVSGARDNLKVRTYSVSDSDYIICSRMAIASL